VTVVAAEGPNSINNHYGETGEAILETIADGMRHYGSTSYYYRLGGFAVAIAPDHMDLIGRDFTRDEARAYLFEHTRRPTSELNRVSRIAKPPSDRLEVDFNALRSPMKDPKQLTFIECGAPGGRFSAVMPHWAASRGFASYAIED
jgi:hypothetical protein